MAKVLVLGANGFIGSHLVDSLVLKGHTVRAFDRFNDIEPVFNKSDQVEVYPGDYLNEAHLEEALRDIEYVFHFISTTTPASAENDPIVDIETNIRMSVELFKLCVAAHVKRVIFASTGGAIYGEALEENVPHKETDPTLPISPYAIGKLTIENYLRYFQVKHGLNSTVFRISNPYGERQPFHRKQGVVPIFLENMYRGLPLTVIGDGSMVRDYLYIGDLADIITSVFESDTLQGLYNIGSGTGTTVNELVKAVESVTGKKAVVETVSTPSTFVHHVVLDTTRLTTDFGMKPKTDLVTGMKATYEYISSEIERTERNS